MNTTTKNLMKRPYQSPSLKVIEFRVELGYAASTPETLDMPLHIGYNSGEMQKYLNASSFDNSSWTGNDAYLSDGDYF